MTSNLIHLESLLYFASITTWFTMPLWRLLLYGKKGSRRSGHTSFKKMIPLSFCLLITPSLLPNSEFFAFSLIDSLIIHLITLLDYSTWLFSWLRSILKMLEKPYFTRVFELRKMAKGHHLLPKRSPFSSGKVTVFFRKGHQLFPIRSPFSSEKVTIFF